MNHNPIPPTDPPFQSDQQLLVDFGALWKEADAIWEQDQETPAYHGYVSADYEAVFESLGQLQGTAATFLEWGSGLGVATIMASRMGFESYGIESEPELIAHSERLAESYGPDAQFIRGSFIPDEYEWNPADGDDGFRTVVNVGSAYDELGMELRDFDLIYAYPWPDEHSIYRNIIRELGHTGAMFLSYDAREGINLTHYREL